VKTIQIDPAFNIELWASEPMFADPVAMEIDEDGRIYVVQNSGYPLDTEHRLGKVWLLADTNGDGKPDKSTLFGDQLTLPTGVMRWKKGIIVTDAPDVLYMEDTNGDGKADVRKVLLTGFALTNPQHTVNSPLYGLDNWIYLAHEGFANAVVYAQKFGDKGSDIRFPDRKDAPSVRNERRNVRFRPDSFQLETTSSTSQFGLAFDTAPAHVEQLQSRARRSHRGPVPGAQSRHDDGLLHARCLRSWQRRAGVFDRQESALRAVERNRRFHVRLRDHVVSGWHAHCRTGARHRASRSMETIRRDVQSFAGERGRRVYCLNRPMVPAVNFIIADGALWQSTITAR
jgi:hypothetical protein